MVKKEPRKEPQEECEDTAALPVSSLDLLAPHHPSAWGRFLHVDPRLGMLLCCYVLFQRDCGVALLGVQRTAVMVVTWDCKQLVVNM